MVQLRQRSAEDFGIHWDCSCLSTNCCFYLFIRFINAVTFHKERKHATDHQQNLQWGVMKNILCVFHESSLATLTCVGNR